MYSLGIDPDLHTPAFAVLHTPTFGVTNSAWINDVRVASSPAQKKLKGYAAVAALVNVIGPEILDLEEKYPQIDKIIIEAQELYRGMTQNPRSIMHLAAATGVIAGVCSIWPDAQVIMPLPKEWKGNVPKRIHQGRIYSRLGWSYEQTTQKNKDTRYCIPKDFGDHPPHNLSQIKDSDWKHIGDAVGLSMWNL